jgi:hypothetical protein
VSVAEGAQVAIINSSVHGNRAGTAGGGVFAQNTAKVTIHNSILIGNTAQNMGGGLLTMHNQVCWWPMVAASIATKHLVDLVGVWKCLGRWC